MAVQLAEYDRELVQAKGSRSVYRLSLAGEVKAYAKVYHPQDLLQRLTNRLRPRTAREARILKRLAECGLRVPKVLGQWRDGNCSTLVTQAIVPGTPLHDLPAAEQPEIMLGLAVELLKAGFVHHDLHWGNIVMGPKGLAYLIDTYEIRQKHIKPADITAMLAQVASLYQLDSRSLTEALEILSATEQVSLAGIRSRAHSLGRRRAQNLVQSCLEEGHFASRRQGPGYTALAFGQQAPDLDAILRQHRQNITTGQNLLKLQAKTQLSVVGGYCVKSYKPAKALTNAYARRAWQGLLTLRFNNLPTAEPVALIENDDRSSVLITGYLKLRGFDRFLYHDFEQLSVKQRYRLIGVYGQLIGRMHARGIYHADLKACNVLVDPANAAYYFVDTDRVETYASLSLEHRIKNLVQINNSIPREVAPPIRMHFMKCYSEETGDDPKQLFAKVWLNSRDQEILYTTDQGDQREFWE